MSILRIITEYIGEAQTASYVPTKAYTGTLPKGVVRRGSKGDDVKALQRFLNWCIGCGLTIDGECGAKTTHAIKLFQKQYKLTIDGVFGEKSLAKAKSIVRAHKVTTIVEKEIEACKQQATWMKNYKYKWQGNPTVAKSKKYGTCVTYVACVLQRIGVLKKGQYIWINERGKVIGANKDKMTVTYLKGTLASNKSKLKKGDIVIGGNGNVHAAGGSHIFVMTGQWKGDSPVIFDQASADRVRKGYKPGHQWNGSFRIIARIRLKGR